MVEKIKPLVDEVVLPSDPRIVPIVTAAGALVDQCRELFERQPDASDDEQLGVWLHHAFVACLQSQKAPAFSAHVALSIVMGQVLAHAIDPAAALDEIVGLALQNLGTVRRATGIGVHRS